MADKQQEVLAREQADAVALARLQGKVDALEAAQEELLELVADDDMVAYELPQPPSEEDLRRGLEDLESEG